jgi:chemotaxis protein histidine kinase CheA
MSGADKKSMSAEDSAFLDGLKKDFLDESRLELDAWEENLLDYDSDGDSSYLDDFKRQVHSMKGSSAAIGLVEANQILHELENWLQRAQSGMSRKDMVTSALKFVDQMRVYCSALANKDNAKVTAAAQALKSLVS